jgi:GlpG protein
VVAFWSNFGGTESGVAPRSIPALVRHLSIVKLPANTAGYFIKLFSRESDVAKGEIWRLVTPILLHFHPLHLAFNMISFASVGRLIETRYGSWRLTWLMLSIAVVSNVVQYWHSGNPMFGGLSGVVFGLFGYVWIKGQFDPRAGFKLQPASVATMLIFLVLCMTGVFGAIANAAHVAGLAMGMIWAAVPLAFERRWGR